MTENAFCGRCGTATTDRADRFCRACGESLISGDPETKAAGTFESVPATVEPGMLVLQESTSIGEPSVLSLGAKFVGEPLRVAVYGNASPSVRDLSTKKWFGIGVAEGILEGALGVSIPGGFAGGMAESMVEVPVVEKLRRKSAKQQVGVANLRGVVGLYCSSNYFYVADLRWGKERPRRTPPKLSHIALRTPLADVSASVHQSGGLDRIRIEGASLQSPLIFTTSPGTNHFSQVAAWMTANG